ncbi:hypothetical protein BUALT_Bualt12G0130700 [Buddleja alternifolia]|uniref:WPP domain-containing protein n=1 Tax=Buddleja alternifolia TaxID=168488 RepID=A0AAV6WZC8_9LAMI|nr:hypothetical protein BUALT_Bualt12G0130700 [Buddleja alternifolia]
MKNNLSTPTIFTHKYWSLNGIEASKHAKQIEESAFASANQHYEQEPDGDGSSAVQLYAKDCSKLILDVLKGGASKIEEKVEVKLKVIDSTSFKAFFDISKGQRAFIDEDEAITLLSPLKEPGNSYTKICFSNQSFGLGAARVGGPILASFKNHLKEVDLSDFVAGRPEAEALDVMNIFSKALEEAAQAVCELVPSTEKLKVLHFHNNMMGDEVAIAISKMLNHCPLLEDFRCSSTRVGSEGGIALTEALSKCKNLKKIDLRDNMFDVEADDGAIAIANALKEAALSLKVLEMAGNDITAKAAPSLANCISRKKILVQLNLSENDFKDDGAIWLELRVLAKALVRLPGLKLLNVNGNFISEEGIDELKNVFKGCMEKLGPLDENDPDGEDFDDKDILGMKMKVMGMSWKQSSRILMSIKKIEHFSCSFRVGISSRLCFDGTFFPLKVSII